jgi:AbiV family abortive infection protein
MAAKRKSIVISRAVLYQGYVAALDNAIRFLGAAESLLVDYPDKALALAQVGQEELGKTLTLAAAAVLPADPDAWKWFWSSWARHELKAHRAYLYELFSFVRIELIGPDDDKYKAGSLRATISQEKEIGFYVDFDEATSAFVSPLSGVRFSEAASRLWTLVYLSVIADGIRNSISRTDSEFRFIAFGELAYRICTEALYQQDMEAELKRFRRTGPRYDAFGNDLEIALKSGEVFLMGLDQSSRSKSAAADG